MNIYSGAVLNRLHNKTVYLCFAYALTDLRQTLRSTKGFIFSTQINLFSLNVSSFFQFS